MGNPKVLIIGANGYLGSRLYKACSTLFPSTLGTTRQVNPYFLYFDLENPDFTSILDHNAYTHAIICAGVTKIALCEQAPQKSWEINVTNTLLLVNELKSRNIKPILFSTDCVFNGEQKNYLDTSPPSPLNTYGEQKAFIEKEVPKICNGNFLTLRLSKTYSIEEKDSTLLHEIAKKLINHQVIHAAVDLCFCPIYIGDVIKAILNFITYNVSGCFNLCGPTYISYAKLCNLLAKQLGSSHNLIKEVSIHELTPSTKRANYLHLKNSSLYKSTFKQSFITINQAIEKISSAYLPEHTL